MWCGFCDGFGSSCVRGLFGVGVVVVIADGVFVCVGYVYDCTGFCGGNAYIDDCDVCDDNPSNDNQTCNAGCTDINANNYNSNATIFNNSCLYSDRIFNVPEEYEKIQDAIYFSSSQDTILVQPGTYYEDIDFLGKDIVLISTLGPENTFITSTMGVSYKLKLSKNI